MKRQDFHTVWCYISGEAAGEIGNWSLLWVKGGLKKKQHTHTQSEITMQGLGTLAGNAKSEKNNRETKQIGPPFMNIRGLNDCELKQAKFTTKRR